MISLFNFKVKVILKEIDSSKVKLFLKKNIPNYSH